ncbi:MAG: hypothetical protein OEX81_05290 [Candidatus Pacebacteria bacterium]|nr:hypothetical protein [Candidatus Paceibacterota bacterium]
MNLQNPISDFVNKYLDWSPELGIRPTGFLDQPEKFGRFEKQNTYLDICPCENEGCNAYVARYTDDASICKEQTIALRQEVANTLSIYLSFKGKVEKLRSTRDEIEEALLNLDMRREENLDNYLKISEVIFNMVTEIMAQWDRIFSSGSMQMRWERADGDEMELGVAYWIPCPLYTQLTEVKLLSAPVDEAKLIKTEIDDSEFTEDDWTTVLGFFREGSSLSNTDSNTEED